MSKLSWFRKRLDVSTRGLGKKPNKVSFSALRVEELERRDVPAAPVYAQIPRQTVLEDAAPIVIDLSTFFTDPEVGAMTFTATSTNTAGLISGGPSIAGNILTLTPAQNAYGYSYIRVTATDGEALSTTGAFELIVREQDDLTSDAGATNPSTSITTSVLANDGGTDIIRQAEAANIQVVQNDTGNATTSVTVTLPQKTPEIAIRSGSNRGDYNIQIGSDATDDNTLGILHTSISNNGRNNGETTGIDYATPNIDLDTAGFFLPQHRIGSGAEMNSDMSVAYFDYKNGWLGAWIRNATGANGGTNVFNDQIRSATPQGGFALTAGSIVDLGGGQTNVTIPGVNSLTDGILLVLHAKNEDNYALGTANPDGSWQISVKDNGTNGTGLEPDPVSFVYVPRNMPNVVSGRLMGDGSVQLSSGNFTMTKTGTGTYTLNIPGQSPSTGILALSPERETSSLNEDNTVSYQASGNNFEIQTRDIIGGAVGDDPALEDVGSTVRVASFAFIPFLNQPTLRVTSVQSTGNTPNVSDLGATLTINPNGTVTYNPLTSTTIQTLAPLQTIVDTYTYTTTSLSGVTSTATVSVTVTAPAQLFAYVDDAWVGLNNNDPIPGDADPVLGGTQSATFGVNAFASISAAIAAAPAGARIVVNSGNYNEAVVIDRQLEIVFQEGNSTVASINDTVSNAVISVQPGVVLTIGDATNSVIDSTISGQGGIIKIGSGDLRLNGINSYSGTTTLSNGTLNVGIAGAIPSGSNVTLAPGTEILTNGNSLSIGSLAGSGDIVNSTASNITITLTNSSNASFTGDFVQSGSGTISLVKLGLFDQVLAGNNAINGTLSINAGSITLGSTTALGAPSAVTVANGATLFLNGNSLTIQALAGSGVISNGAVTAAVLAFGHPTTDSTTTLSFVDGATGKLALVKNGTGLFAANASSSFSGGLTVSSGTFQTNAVNGFGTGSVILGDANTAGNNVALLATGTLTAPNPITVSGLGTGTVTIGSLGITTQTSFSGALTLNRDVILQGGSTDRTNFTGQITGTGNVTTTATVSGNRVVFSRGTATANNYSGNLTIGAGSVVQLGVGSTIGNSNIPDSASITFTDALSELRLTPANTAAINDVEAVNALVSLVPGAGLITKTTGTGAGSTMTLIVGSANGSGSFSGVISNAVGILNIAKTGSGTQTLTGASTYSGTTTVNAGTLVANNTTGSAFGTSAVIVDPNGILTGTGSFTGSVVVNGRLAPGGFGVTADIATGSLSFGSGGTLVVDLNNTTPNTGHDQLIASDVTGSLSGARLQILTGAGLALNDTFTILVNSGTGTTGGPFSNGSTIQSANNPLITFTVTTNTGTDNNEIVLTVTNIATGPTLDEVGGVATFNTAAGDNNISLTNNGTSFTLTDTTGTIALSPAAISAGWSIVSPGTVTRSMTGVASFAMNLGGGTNTVTTFNAGSANVTISGSSTVAVAGVTTTGNLLFGDFTNVSVTGSVSAANISSSSVDSITGTPSGKLIAATGTITLSAPNGIGTTVAPLSTQAGTLVLSGGAAGINITEDDGANVTASALSAGNISIANLAGTLTISGATSTAVGNLNITSAGGLTVSAAVSTTFGGAVTLGAGTTLNVQSAITSTGNITLNSANDVILAANLNAGSSTVAINANTDGAGNQGFSQTTGTITTTNTGASALVITVNTPTGGTGNASLDSTAVSGGLTVNTNGGSVLFAGTGDLTSGQIGTTNGGSAPTRRLVARDFVFTATGAGSVGTDLRPIQTFVPATNTINISAGSGGAFLTDWNEPVFLTGATATGTGNIRIVSANVGGHNLTVNGPVTTGSGNIYLAADDDLNINAPIGGPGFSGTVYLAGNRDLGNTANARMNSGSSIVTSNNTANAVLIESNSNNGTASGGITLNNITVGDGGTITVSTRASSSSFGDITALNSSVILNAGPTGRVVFIAPQYAVASNAIGSSTTPINVTAGTVSATAIAATATNGSIFINGTGPTAFTATITGTGSNRGSINLSTTAGLLSINGPTSTVNGGAINLTSTGSAGGIAITAPVTGTGNYTLNAGTNTVSVANNLSIAGRTTFAIATATDNAGLVTITTSAAHTLTVGETVEISGVDIGGYNGVFTVTAATTTTFSYMRSNTGSLTAGSGGVATNSLRTLTTTATGFTAVTTGGTLSGAGLTASPITLSSGATISPNSTGLGVLNIGNLTGSTGANFRVDINGTGIAGTNFDQLSSTGNINLNGLTPQVFLGSNYIPVVGDSFDVITTTGSLTGFSPSTFNATNVPAVTLTTSSPTSNVVRFTVSAITVNPTLNVVNGVLTYSAGASEDNTLTVSYDANTGLYTFTEAVEFIALGAGAQAAGFTLVNPVGLNSRTISGPASAITAGANISLNAGTDSLTLNGLVNPFTVDGSGGASDTATINGVLNANGAFSLIGFNTITAAPGTLINATNLALSALSGIGSGSQSILTQAVSISATAGGGGIFISEADGADITANTTNTGTITFTNGTGTLNVAGATGTDGGSITLSSADAVTLGANITTTNGSVTINANTDGAGNQGFDQKGFEINAGSFGLSDFNLTVNTPTGGTGDAVIGKGSFANAVNITSNGGNILWSNDPAYLPFTPSNTGLGNGGGFSDSLRGRFYSFTTGSSGSVGTDARPLQLDNYGIDAAADAPANLVATAGTGGIFTTVWNSLGGLDLTTGNLTAQGAGNIRVVAANAGGHSLWIRGNVSTGSGNIFLASDDNIDVGPGIIIGGAGFSGTVWMQANRDQGTPGQVFSFDPTSSIMTSNTTNVATSTKTPLTQAVYLDISGDLGAPSNLRLSNITVGNGGRIVATAIPNGSAAEAGRVLSNRLPGEPMLLLDAGANGTVEIAANINNTSSSPTGNSMDAIGIAPGSNSPLHIVAGTFVGTASNFSNVTVSSSVATNIQLTGFQATANTGTSPDISLTTTNGPLTIGSALTNFNKGQIILNGASGVVLNSAIGSATTGAISITGPLSGNGNVIQGTGSLTVLQGTNSTYDGSVSGNQAFVKDGAGILTLSNTSLNAFTGATNINTGGLIVNGALAKTSPVTVADTTTLAGTGTIGDVTVSGSITGGGFGSTGILSTRNLAFGTVGSRTFVADINGIGSHDQLNVTGTVDLTGATLSINPALTGLVALDKYVIINNDGSDGMLNNSTFTGLAEGDFITVGAHKFQISYSGGTNSNDVVLTKTGTATTTTLTGPAGPAIVGNSLTFTATIAPANASPAPTGTVTFFINGVAQTPVAVSTNAGVTTATFSTNTLSVGVYSIVAVYNGDTNFGTSTSTPPFSQTINPAVPAPTVSGVLVNGTTAPSAAFTASRLTSLVVNVNTPVTVDTTSTPAFSITNGTVTLTNATNGGLIVTPVGNSVSIAFDPAVAGVESGSLSDGIWTLTVDQSKLKNSANVAGTGTTTTADIRRLFGDFDGNGVVSQDDFDQFGNTFGLTSSDPGFISLFDFDENGVVSQDDFDQFGNRFGISLT